MPSVALLSDGFRQQARYQAEILDAAAVPQLFVKHPISDQTEEQLYAKADQAIDDVVKALSAPWTPVALSKADKEEAKAAAEEPECSS